MQVGEGVMGTAVDEELFAGADLDGFAIDEPGGDAVDADDGLVVVAVEVRDGQVGELGGDGDFEEIEEILGFVTALQEGDGYLAYADGLVNDVPPFEFPDAGGLVGALCRYRDTVGYPTL